MIFVGSPRSALLLAMITALLLGCGRGGAGVSEKRTSHVQALTTLHFRAASILAKNPESEEEFKQAFANDNLDLGVLGVSSLDDLFVSDRDGQPIVVIYGQPPKGVAPGVIAYEHSGKDGIRIVGFSNGQIEEADQSRFAQLVKSPGPG